MNAAGQLAVAWRVRAAERFGRIKPPLRYFGDALAAWSAVRPVSLLAELPGAQCRLAVPSATNSAIFAVLPLAESYSTRTLPTGFSFLSSRS